MGAYKVICHFLEMPYGRIFRTIPKFPYDMGELALFSLIGFPDGELLIPGRFYTDPNEGSWIQLPGLRIDIPEEIRVDVIGIVDEFDVAQCLN